MQNLWFEYVMPVLSVTSALDVQEQGQLDLRVLGRVPDFFFF